MSAPEPRGLPRSHWRPRTPEGRSAVRWFVALFLLCMPPVSHTLLDRVEPTVLGLPFFWLALLVVYSLLIVVLVRAYRQGL